MKVLTLFIGLFVLQLNCFAGVEGDFYKEMAYQKIDKILTNSYPDEFFKKMISSENTNFICGVTIANNLRCIRLGNDYSEETIVPLEVNNVKNIYMGDTYTVIINNKNEIFSWGYGKEKDDLLKKFSVLSKKKSAEKLFPIFF